MGAASAWRGRRHGAVQLGRRGPACRARSGAPHPQTWSANVGVGARRQSALLLAPQWSLPKPEATRWLLWGGPSLLILAGALGMEVGGWLPRLSLLRALGDASYSIYLTQMLALPVLKPALGWLPAPVAVPLAIAGCGLVGLACHWALERPLLRLFGAAAPPGDQGARRAARAASAS